MSHYIKISYESQRKGNDWVSGMAKGKGLTQGVKPVMGY